MDNQPPRVPFEPYAQALSNQRNQALDAVAELQALVHQLTTDNERITAEVEKLRAESGGPISGS